MPTVSEFDDLPAAHAAELVRPCCGAARWVAEMVARRPFGTLEQLLEESDDVWWSLDPDDWREAFAHHPRIGERASGWSAGEQAGVADASADVRAELAAANDAYEARFGHVYLVRATGRSADELLALARARLANDAEAELRVAAEEQRQITRLRLEKLFAGDDA
jgi:OHCU decarboxylase